MTETRLKALSVFVVIGTFIILFFWFYPTSKKATVVAFSWERISEEQRLVTVEKKSEDPPDDVKITRKEDEECGLIDVNGIQFYDYCTQYYYEVQKWETVKEHKVRGNDRNPYWYASEMPADRRIIEKKAVYIILVRGEDGKVYKPTVSFDRWMSIEIGEEISISVNVFGHVFGVG